MKNPFQVFEFKLLMMAVLMILITALFAVFQILLKGR